MELPSTDEIIEADEAEEVHAPIYRGSQRSAYEAEELRLLRELEKNRRAAAATPFSDDKLFHLLDGEAALLAALDRHREGR